MHTQHKESIIDRSPTWIHGNEKDSWLPLRGKNSYGNTIYRINSNYFFATGVKLGTYL